LVSELIAINVVVVQQEHHKKSGKRILNPPTTTIVFLPFKPEKMHSPIALTHPLNPNLSLSVRQQ